MSPNKNLGFCNIGFWSRLDILLLIYQLGDQTFDWQRIGCSQSAS